MLQLPGVTTELAKKASEAGVENVFDLMDMEDDDRNKLLGMSEVRACERACVGGCILTRARCLWFVFLCVCVCVCLSDTHMTDHCSLPPPSLAPSNLPPPPSVPYPLPPYLPSVPLPVLSHFPCEHQSKLAALAAVCNRYPNVSLEYQVVDADEVSAGEQVQIVVKLERENEVLSVLS